MSNEFFVYKIDFYEPEFYSIFIFYKSHNYHIVSVLIKKMT